MRIGTPALICGGIGLEPLVLVAASRVWVWEGSAVFRGGGRGASSTSRPAEAISGRFARQCLGCEAAFSVVEKTGRRVMRADERVIAIGEHGNSARRGVHIVGPDVIMTLDES